ncbi:serine/threonine protein kinase [Amycolatopsis balhimycina DSM 5908]|uniref:non-specific serine/threonine protein kinase n=1 Tax=Amycolatopsis balhimycina DSM 5908 TaxID=1081091 RepID=A0A428W801_AMYBA|nr:serine/threonine-protein kinase [Amycolatopsis balhimycina]RSM39153.1 serine/threonine protein kinase [Amycolatopsis balhimycina DSM 5908]
MSEEPRRPRHAAPDDGQQPVPTPTWQPPPPVRWETPEPSISGRLDDGEPSGGEQTVFHAPVRRPPTPPRGQPSTARAPIPGAEDPTRPPGSINPVLPPVQPTQAVAPPTQAVRPDPDAPQPTSVLASPTPETQSIRPPAPRPDTGPGAPLPDPGTESVLPERTSEGRPTGTGTGSGTGSGSGSGPGAFPGTSRRTSSRTSRSRRGRLGAGLVDVPPVPARDPASAVLTDPVVSEEKRYCGSCGAKVGRGKDGKPGTAEGKCENCGAPFSFVPKLEPNELVGGQYEVLGAIAYGGLGWIYLAQDHNVSDRWVVLKGLIDTGDATAMAAAANEQRFLAEVEHPNIVKIHNFVQHPDAHSGTTVGYIVMEYVGGQSLRQLALAHHRESRRPEPLPIGQVIAYGLEILPALGYLHSQGLLYCDLKPDNVIQTNEQLKLIDLGAVRRTDDYESPLFFTTGYSAPELPTQGASIASDLFTVGRTLAVLSFEFTGYTTKFKTTLPGPDAVPLFALFGSYYRFLRRATHADPDRRFLSAEEMSDQLTGVLREIMALGTGKPRPGASTVFGPESRTFGVQLVVPEAGASVPLPGADEVVAGLPIPQVDTDDPAAGVLATTTALEPRGAIEALAGAPRESIEVRLRIVRARIELGELAEAQRQLQAAQYLAIKNGFPHDWRIDWYRGLIELAGGRSRVAHVAFEAVYDDLPGEIAPKLALGVSAEGVGDYFAAARFYELVWRTDRSYVSAAFGLARVYLAQGARAGAVEVLETVPPSSTHYIDAQVAAIKIKTTATKANGRETPVTEHDLLDASARLERLRLDAERRTRLSANVLEAAYEWLRAPKQGGSTPGARVLGCALEERELRFGLERCYRALARLAATIEQRVELVDRANAIRPRTLT